MSSTGPAEGRYCPISSRKRWRRIQKRAQQYARTTGSSYARITLRIVSLLIDRVAEASRASAVARVEPALQLRKALEALGPPGRPPAVEHDHEARRMGSEVAHQFCPEPVNLGCVLVVEEVEVVEKAGGLSRAHPQQRVQTPVGRVEHLHGVPGVELPQISGQLANGIGLVSNPA